MYFMTMFGQSPNFVRLDSTRLLSGHFASLDISLACMYCSRPWYLALLHPHGEGWDLPHQKYLSVHLHVLYLVHTLDASMHPCQDASPTVDHC